MVRFLFGFLIVFTPLISLHKFPGFTPFRIFFVVYVNGEINDKQSSQDVIDCIVHALKLRQYDHFTKWLRLRYDLLFF